MNTSKNKKLFIPLIGIVILCLLIGSFYFKKYRWGSSTYNNLLQFSQDNTKTEKFAKYQTDINSKFFQKKDYPQELMNINENNIIGMNCFESSCKPPYQNCGILNGTIPGESPTPPEITNFEVSNLFKEADRTIDKLTSPGDTEKYVNDLTICKTEDDRQILEYQTIDAKNLSYLGVVNSDKTVKKIASIFVNSDYFRCTQPLFLTKDQNLYYICDDNGGPRNTKPFISRSIYKINLVKGSNNLIYECKITWNEEVQKNITICN